MIIHDGKRGRSLMKSYLIRVNKELTKRIRVNKVDGEGIEQG
jgi:hypothetical protein